MKSNIPTFYLFGEPHRHVEASFVHVESLDDRSRPNEWTIIPHAHAELMHLFYVSRGGGTVHADTNRLHCHAPCLILIPAGVVHGFDWMVDTEGHVVTLATRRLSDLGQLSRERALLPSTPEVIVLTSDDRIRIEGHITDLMRELSWAQVGHEAALQAALLAIFVIVLRQRRATPASGGPDGRYRSLVARLRQRIEDRFRLRETVASHAAALGTSETALRIACMRVAGISPAAMLNQRALLEAKRALLFSDLSVSEIAFSLGFEDAAYFSRFFSNHVRQSPRAYRTAQRKASVD